MNLFADFFKFLKFLILKIPANLQKMCVNNETLQKPIAEKDYGVCPSELFLDPTPRAPLLLSILYMTTYFSANLLLFMFLLFRVRLG